MNKGDRVRVWPEGQPERAKVGDVVLISPDELSAAVQFDEMPLFLAGEGFGVDTSTGRVTMVLARNVTADPWHQLQEPDGGTYEMGPV
jgi:hypothetical protein